ncbi:MAG: hypothetical protein WAZ77_20885 [Candidatus Nitrosopolaris sp.]
MRHRQASVNGYESKKEWSAVQHVERVGMLRLRGLQDTEHYSSYYDSALSITAGCGVYRFVRNASKPQTHRMFLYSFMPLITRTRYLISR